LRRIQAQAPKLAARRTDRELVPLQRRQIDLFLIYCPDTDQVYALDVGEAASSNGRLRVDPAANGQAKGIRWAADHELPA
jgi:hypothetical protein